MAKVCLSGNGFGDAAKGEGGLMGCHFTCPGALRER